MNGECPLPLARHATVQLAHGGGGRLMRELIEQVFLGEFGGPALAERHDSMVLATSTRTAFTTDGYVVQPRFFPGGDVGSLAVTGTVNDLAMAGAVPRWLSAGFIIEEGLPMDELVRIARSMRAAAERCGVTLCTGDTKVVDRGKADGVFITTSGLGDVPEGVEVHARRVHPGDVLLLSGDVGRHGIAVLSVREGLAFESAVESDCAPLHGLVIAMRDAGVDIRWLRDPTRGGLATVLAELALDAGLGIEVDEAAIPLSDEVAGACEVLGLDPLYVACEGRLVACVAAADAARTLSAMRALPEGAGAACIGRVTVGPPGRVTLATRMGSHRLLDLLSGEQLPRIC